jgi:hypothetical protein
MLVAMKFGGIASTGREPEVLTMNNGASIIPSSEVEHSGTSTHISSYTHGWMIYDTFYTAYHSYQS